MLLVNHFIGLEDLRDIDHNFNVMRLADAVHLIEDLLFLTLDFNAFGLSDSSKTITKLVEWNIAIVYINDHHHGEEVFKDGLVDVKDIDVVICKIGANCGDDTYGIFADNCNDGTVHIINY